MPTYVYGCKQHPESQCEVVHGFADNPLMPCPVCQKAMHRIPQAFRFYNNPANVLMDRMIDRFTEYRKEKKYGIQRKHKRGSPLFG